MCGQDFAPVIAGSPDRMADMAGNAAAFDRQTAPVSWPG
jgi:hypothetical protein